MTNTKLAILGTVIAGLSVLFGAFGAHGLESSSEQWPEATRQKRLDNWATAAQYQMFHGLAMLAAAAWMNSVCPTGVATNGSSGGGRLAHTAAWGFLIGTILFCGSLYLYTLTGITKFGAVTPIGGLAWLVAWTCLGLAVAKEPSRTQTS